MKHTLSVLVENHAGVLSRISGLFARRGYNIDSLAVGITEDPSISRMTIVVNGDNYILEQVEKQLNKLIDVIKVQRLKEGEYISRELVLYKIFCSTNDRNAIMDTVKIMDA
ncbi:MAG: acetolactate synthase small subunit, partial [Oscillospiraceae bacterium]